MQMDVQLDANAVLHPVIQNRRPAGPRDRRKKNLLFQQRIKSVICPTA
jgi:hypothetical protein